MAIERAVVAARLSGLVEIRNMFTCDVVPVGGDTPQILWSAYLTSIYDPIEDLLATNFLTYQYELQQYSGGHWIPYDLVDFSHGGTDSGALLPNAVSAVLVAKALGLRHIGRKFLGAITVGKINGNNLTTAALALAASVLLAYITPFTGLGSGTITPGVVDKYGVFHAFVGGTVATLLGSMRRRKPGIGI